MLSHSYQKLVKFIDRLPACFLHPGGHADGLRLQKLLGVCDLFIYPTEKPLLEAIDDHAVPKLP
jgi:hypothetical protein